MEQIYSVKINIKGIVQGVGFRPFVYRVAALFGVNGYVCNNLSGVQIIAQADKRCVEQFIEHLHNHAPNKARIYNMSIIDDEASVKYNNFIIIKSNLEHESSAMITPDYALCDRCLYEFRDINNRRYKYPFISCTDCGARWSILKSLPYDRDNTSMSDFNMCKECYDEFNNPESIRFCSQINACAVCGPRLFLFDTHGAIMTKDIFKDIASFLRAGKIIALKGVGGFALICDALNADVIRRLRICKNRPQKPFAIMFPSIHTLTDYAFCTAQEQELLRSSAAPIVLLRHKNNMPTFSDISPKSPYLGAILPYSALHYGILDEFCSPVIFTSANISGEPIISHRDELEQNLKGVYDILVDYNRDIIHPCDDSVLMVIDSQAYPLRVARGLAPVSIPVPNAFKAPCFALGAQQKSTISLGFEQQIIVSQHIGDLKSLGSLELWNKIRFFLEKNYTTVQRAVADMNPQYITTSMAKEFPYSSFVQHHHAHILALMAEHKLTQKVIGVVFDGSGYGSDGSIWGGEFFVACMDGFERCFYLRPLKLLGVSRAIFEPKRILLALLFDIYGKSALEYETVKHFFSKEEIEKLYAMYVQHINTIEVTSAGRLFDAVASLLVDSPFCVSYDGECGLYLESLFDSSLEKHSYDIEFNGREINYIPMIKDMIYEKQRHTKTYIATKFFYTLANMIVRTVERIYNKEGELPVLLSGGVMCNRVLLEILIEIFKEKNIPYYIHCKTPPNDACISLGQSYYTLYNNL